ncbi:family 20 glycosylhydrolase [Streptomyces sp. NPDC059352]|uniref:family 20 glycosylhydrolase n=1 Tax=Streptomyces sp. NPDC059352 TaxID=3346810 RepID=UPI00368B9F4D
MRPMRPRGRNLATLVALTLALASLVPATATAAPKPPVTAPTPAVVPQPVSQASLSGSGFTLTAQTPVNVISSSDPDAAGVGTYLAGLLAPATGYTLPVTTTSQPVSQAIVLNPKGASTLGAEGYTLKSTGTGVTVTAYGAQGLFRGVQTLRQLLPAAIESTSVKPGPWTVAPVQISDNARYSYRGVMVDVARRFFPMDQLKRYIDQAAMYKINTLHLHLTDDQGWRIAIGAIPSLTTVGASTQSGFTGGTDWYYTAAEYQEIVAYAKSRFMTVVPEIDGPGHINSALASVPDLNCDDQPSPLYSGFEVGISLYCLSDPEHVTNVSGFLTTVIDTVAAMTPGPYVHLGGDETPQATPSQYAAYVSAATSAVTARGKSVMGWHQLGQSTIPANSIMQWWGDSEDRASIGTTSETEDVHFVRNAVQQNAKFVMSPSDHAYLDMEYDSSTPYGLSWQGPVSLSKAYDWDPTISTAKLDGTGSLVPADKIAGVEAVLWADRAYAGSHRLDPSTSQFPEPYVYAEHMTFPRLPAIAEIGWSPRSTHNYTDFSRRLGTHGARWTAAGIEYYAAPDVPWSTPPSGNSLIGVRTLTTGGKALDVPGSSGALDTQLDTWTAHGGNNQKWTFVKQPDGSYILVNVASGLCADVSHGSLSAGAPIVQWTCSGTTNQRWQVTPAAGGGHTLTSVDSGLLLTTASTADGALVTQEPANGSALQRWTIG